jgi:UDP-N-acetylmuramoyl-tripeptide--D-alanyl-D-alanine ligase
VIELAPERIAAEAGATVVATGSRERPERATIDSRDVRPGDLFFGLPGEHADGGSYAAAALEAGAWGVLVRPERAEGLPAGGWWVLAADEPLRALQLLARAWRRQLGCQVVGITGSTGKTSVKDIARTLLPLRVHASPENYNTEIGLPLTILSAPVEAEVLVLEMAMRGLGQIAELCEIAEPGVAAITNVGPVHLELLGTLEAIAEAKAEIIGGLRGSGTAVVPADAEALEPHLHDRLETITFGAGGDVSAHDVDPLGRGVATRITTPAGEARFELPFAEAHNVVNTLCAVGIGVALGCEPGAMARRAPGIEFSRLRGELVELRGGIVIVNDCYNANPISMRAALENLAMGVAGVAPEARRVAVLGDMKELGRDAAAYHREVGALARNLGVDPVIGVGELAREYAPDAWAPDADAAIELVDSELVDGDSVLIKGSRSVGLERVTEALVASRGAG